MRRLLLAAALLALPTVGRAENEPGFPVFHGCAAKLGCYDLSFTVINPGDLDPARLYGVVTCSPGSACVPIARYEAWLLDANGLPAWDGETGDFPKEFVGVPATGFLVVHPDRPEMGFVTIPVTTTPEPASIVLLGSGLAGMLAVRRRRRVA